MPPGPPQGSADQTWPTDPPPLVTKQQGRGSHQGGMDPLCGWPRGPSHISALRAPGPRPGQDSLLAKQL